ncbi:MAG: glycosyltransferase family 4 protein [Bacillota bacterium]|nr:glycosyltransferase family 4 protein [Bacillota bacterium]
MRVAILHWAFPPVVGGVETHLALLCPRLAAAGWEVHLLTGAVPERPEVEEWRGVRIRRSPLLQLNLLSPAEIARQRESICSLVAGFLAEVRPHLVHCHNFHYFSPVHARAVLDYCSTAGIPALLTAHNVWSDGLWREMSELAGRWQAVIAVSHYIRAELIRSGYPAHRIRVIYHGTDVERFAEAGREEEGASAFFPELPPGRRVIFHPARLSLDKGCDLAVRALALIRREVPAAVLLLAGTGSIVDWEGRQKQDLEVIRRLVEELDLERHVLIRHFSWEEMPRVYRRAEVCVYPSRFEEPFGLAVIEAMAAGKPIVASRAGGMPELIQPGRTGYLVAREDSRHLAEVCLALLQNPRLARQIGEAGQCEARRRFTVERMVAETEGLYRQLVTAERKEAVL